MTTSTSPDNTPETTPSTSSPTSSPTSSQHRPGHQRDDLVPQSPSPTEGDEVSEPPRPRPGTTSQARPEPHAVDPASSTPCADATELDEAAIRERAEFWASRDPENTQRGLYDRHAVAFAREVVALLAALDEARAELHDEQLACVAHSIAAVEPIAKERDEALARAEAAEGALAAVREWAQQYVGQWHVASQTPLTFDGGVGAAAHDVLDALAAHPAPLSETADGYQCPNCEWTQKPHPAYGWQRHDERAVEVHKTQLCPARSTSRTDQ